MRIRALLIASLAVLLPTLMGPIPAAFAQAEPRVVTLLARKSTPEHDNYVDAVFSFEHGVNGEEGKRITRNDWDVIFGNSPEPDSFDVHMVTDDCSRIQDLGELNWGAPVRIHPLTPHPGPAREPSVKAVVGHMYLVHTADSDTELYALFRVEALEPGKSCYHLLEGDSVPRRTAGVSLSAPGSLEAPRSGGYSTRGGPFLIRSRISLNDEL